MTRRAELHPSCQASVYASNVRAHTRKVFEELAARYAIHYAWGNGPTGDHAAGRALDLMAYSRGDFTLTSHGSIRPGWNRTVAEYAWSQRSRLGVAYIIYDQLIISTNPNSSAGAYNRWVRYSGTSHANHVHLSLVDNPPAYKPPTPEEDNMTPQELMNYKVGASRWAVDAGLYETSGKRPEDWTVKDHLTNTGAHMRGQRFQDNRALKAELAANTALLRKLIAGAGALTEGQVADAVASGVRAAIDPAELAAAIAEQLDPQVDVAAVEAALRTVLGGLDQPGGE